MIAHLASDAIRWRPQRIVLGHDLRVQNDALQLVHDGIVHVRLFANDRVVLVVGVVGVAQLAIRPELELEELVPEFAFVADIVAQIEVLGRHGSGIGGAFPRKIRGLFGFSEEDGRRRRWFFVFSAPSLPTTIERLDDSDSRMRSMALFFFSHKT